MTSLGSSGATSGAKVELVIKHEALGTRSLRINEKHKSNEAENFSSFKWENWEKKQVSKDTCTVDGDKFEFVLVRRGGNNELNGSSDKEFQDTCPLSKPWSHNITYSGASAFVGSPSSNPLFSLLDLESIPTPIPSRHRLAKKWKRYLYHLSIVTGQEDSACHYSLDASSSKFSSSSSSPPPYSCHSGAPTDATSEYTSVSSGGALETSNTTTGGSDSSGANGPLNIVSDCHKPDAPTYPSAGNSDAPDSSNITSDRRCPPGAKSKLSNARIADGSTKDAPVVKTRDFTTYGRNANGSSTADIPILSAPLHTVNRLPSICSSWELNVRFCNSQRMVVSGQWQDWVNPAQK